MTHGQNEASTTGGLLVGPSSISAAMVHVLRTTVIFRWEASLVSEVAAGQTLLSPRPRQTTSQAIQLAAEAREMEPLRP